MRLKIVGLALIISSLPLLGQAQSVSDEAMSKAIKTMKQSGPHGSYDPHINLSVDKLIDIAIQHWSEGRPDDAFQQLQQTQQQYPAHYKVFAVRASFHLQSNNVSAALAELNQALTLKPDDVDALVNRAQALLRFNRGEEALRDLDAALMINADSLAANFNRGTLLYSKQKFEQALADFDHSIALDPHMPAPYFNRAMTLDALGKRDQAIADLERFLELTDNEGWRQSAEQQLQAWQGSTPASAETQPQGNG